MKRRIVLVVELPLSRRDFHRFGVAHFQELGMAVEVWEMSDWLLPLSRAHAHSPAHGVPVLAVKNVSHLRELLCSLTSSDTVILIGLARIPHNLDRAQMLSSILASQASVGAVSIGRIPSSPAKVELKQRLIMTIRKVQRRLWRHLTIPRPLDFLWVDTSLEEVDVRLLGESTLVRYIHALDFDLLLGLSRETPESPYALILDSLGSRHPDWETLGIANPWKEMCFEDLCRGVISRLHERKMRVIVAAHPRATMDVMADLYPNCEIVFGNTAKLISGASFVLSLEGSTSLGIAAALRVPIVCISTTCQGEYTRLLMGAFCRALGIEPVDLDLLSQVELPPAIPDLEYANYVSNFMKRPHTKDQPFWQQVAQDLRNP